MKTSTRKSLVSVVLAISVFAAFIWWYPFFFSIGWPSLALARAGVPHSWIVSAILIGGGITGLGFWSRTQSWMRVIIASLIPAASYCTLAFWFAARSAVPLPALTPYDSVTAERAAYLEAYESGYRNGQLGWVRSYCFYAKPKTRGFYDGAYQSRIVWYRMFGRLMPEHVRKHIESSALIDGVSLEPK